MLNRTKTLIDLINYNQPLDWIKLSLEKFSWDSHQDYVILQRNHIISVLERYQQDDLFANQIEEWANIIECREDIGYEKEHEEILQDYIHILANPLLTQELSKQNAQYLLNILRQ